MVGTKLRIRLVVSFLTDLFVRESFFCDMSIVKTASSVIDAQVS